MGAGERPRRRRRAPRGRSGGATRGRRPRSKGLGACARRDPVEVGARGGVAAGVEAVGDASARRSPRRRRGPSPFRLGRRSRGSAGCGVEARHLATGMDAGVGTARPRSARPLAQHRGQHSLQLTWTVRSPGCPGPAAECRTRRLDQQPHSRHSGGLRRLDRTRCASSSPTTTGISATGLNARAESCASSPATTSTWSPPTPTAARPRAASPPARRSAVEEVRFGDGDHDTPPTHPRRLRPLRRARPARRPTRPDRLRDQPRRQPRRRHHLLGHRRRRLRGDRARHPRGGDLPAVLGRRRSAASADAPTSRWLPRLRPSW